MYSCSPVELKHSPSYMLGNLALSPRHMAYLHNCAELLSLVVKSLSSQKQTLIDLTKDTTVTDFAYVSLKDTWYLVLLTNCEMNSQVTVYNEAGTSKVPLESQESRGLFRGISVFSDSAVLLGSTLGTPFLLSKEEGSFSLSPLDSYEAMDKVEHMAYSKESGTLVTVQENRTLSTGQVVQKQLEKRHTTELEDGVTGLRTEFSQGKEYLFVSNFNGQVLVYCLDSLTLLVTINSNLRLITALDTRVTPKGVVVLAGAEDS